MKRIVTAAHMKYLDDRTIQHHGMNQLVLMERAAMAVIKHLNTFDLSSILVVCGSGNNGGDGIAIARLLHLAGTKVSVFFAGNPQKKSDGCKAQSEIADSYGVRWVNNPDYSEYTTIVDALFGVGLSRDITGAYAEIIHAINQVDVPVIAVDIPSGVCADTGKVLGCAVHADMTISFAYKKVGQLIQPGKNYCGKVITEDIGIYHSEEVAFPSYFTIEKEDLNLVPERPKAGNKGTFGKVLLIAGSPEMPGASLLCGHAILRTGAGMLKIVAPMENRELIATALPEGMLALYESADTAISQIEKGFQWADVVVIGPGIGISQISTTIVEYVLTHCQLPLVIDADAINIISSHLDWLGAVSCKCILTPHVGEMARLLHLNISEVKSNMLQLVRSFAKKYQVQCICKDSATCIVLPDVSTFINETGNCGMATAGSGDVLTGIIGGLLAVGTPWEYAGALGVYLHGMAGDRLSEKYGTAHLIAGDLIKELADFRLGEKGGKTHERI